jgi:phosphomannomutase
MGKRGRPLGAKDKKPRKPRTRTFVRTRAEIAAGLTIEEAQQQRPSPKDLKEEKRANRERKKEATRRRRKIRCLESRIQKKEQLITGLKQEIQQIKGIQASGQNNNGFKTVVTGAITMRDGRPFIFTKNGNFMSSNEPLIRIVVEHRKELASDTLNEFHQWLRRVLGSLVHCP